MILAVITILTVGSIYYMSSSKYNGNRGTSIPEFITENVTFEQKWHMKHDKFERINENVIYNKFNITKPKARPFVNIIYIVSSAPTRIERRTTIRETWWGDCKNTNRVSMFI